jgi:hypothetical protein
MTGKSNRIDLGLAILAALARPNESLFHAEIAAWCDRSDDTIRNIEKPALHKLRRALACLDIKAESPQDLGVLGALAAAAVHGRAIEH